MYRSKLKVFICDFIKSYSFTYLSYLYILLFNIIIDNISIDFLKIFNDHFASIIYEPRLEKPPVLISLLEEACFEAA